LIVETAIQKKTGSNPWRMIVTRLSGSFIAAILLNVILPVQPIIAPVNLIHETKEFVPEFHIWFANISVTILKIVILVNLLLILQKILNEFGLIKWLLMPFTPLLRIMGLPASTGFLWMVAYTLGLSYGGAIMISQSEEVKLNPEDADLLNHHIALSHSQLEDTLLFVAVGYPIVILVLPRILLAIVYVWIRRFELWVKKVS